MTKATHAPTFQPHDIETHALDSRAVDAPFQIRVWQPISRADASERFPVVYVTDADDLFAGIAALANMMQFHGEVPRFILVGIGYGNALSGAVLRMRDLLPRSVRVRLAAEMKQLADMPFDAQVQQGPGFESTDATEFLQFVREELMPFIDARYPTVPADSSYFGYSAGGTFGLYTLVTQPATFKRYILGSPGTSHLGHHFGIELAAPLVESGRAAQARVFLCVGELEEFKAAFSQYDLVSGCYRMAKFLMQARNPGLEVIFKVLPGETHATAWTGAFSQGLKALFGPAKSVPFWPRATAESDAERP